MLPILPKFSSVYNSATGSNDPSLSFSWRFYHNEIYTKHKLVLESYGVKGLPSVEKVKIIPHEEGQDYNFLVVGDDNIFSALCWCLETPQGQAGDKTFLEYANKALEQLRAHPENITAQNVERFTLNLLRKKQALQDVYNQLLAMTAELEIVIESPLDFSNIAGDDFNAVLKAIDTLAIQNASLYGQITAVARKKCGEYNQLTAQMAVAAEAQQFLNDNDKFAKLSLNDETSSSGDEMARSDLESETVSSEENETYFSEKDEETFSMSKRMLREQMPLIESHAYRDPKKMFSDLRVNISGDDVVRLKSSIIDLNNQHDSGKEKLEEWYSFWQTIRSWYPLTYQSTFRILRAENGLAEQFDALVSNQPVTEQDQKMHQFNSTESPLIAVMEDKSLTEQQKCFFLEMLGQKKPYRTPQQAAEHRKNVHLPKDGETPLYYAVRCGSVQMIRILMQQKALIDVPANGYNDAPSTTGKSIGLNGATALHCAVVLNDFDKVQLLMAAGAGVTAVDAHGRTPLHLAGSVAMAKLLLDKAPQLLSAQDKQQQTPLHTAVEGNQLAVVNFLLLQKGIEINCKDKEGNTPLHLATNKHFKASSSYSFYRDSTPQGTDIEIMKSLLGAGVKINELNKFGETPLHLAIKIKDDLDWDKKLGSNRRKIDLLCLHGADAQLVDVSSQPWRKLKPPLHTVICKYTDACDGYEQNAVIEILKKLIAQGANIFSVDVDGYTCIHHAAKNQAVEVLKFLMEQPGVTDFLRKYPNDSKVPSPLRLIYSESPHYRATYSRSLPEDLKVLLEQKNVPVSAPVMRV